MLYKLSKILPEIRKLLVIAGYDDEFKDKVEEYASRNTKLLPTDRIYIDFNVEEKLIKAPDDLRYYLENYGFEIADYNKGLCKDSRGRLIRIGKVLEKLKSKDPAAKSMLEFYKSDTNRQFILDGKNLEVIISQEPKDIATMSYERNWTSCLDLSGGSRVSNIYCELASGGIVAYLVYKNDRDIKNPISRIHIRRFSSEDDSILVPEDDMYGVDVEPFYDLIVEWCKVFNAGKKGTYFLSGSTVSDTFKQIEPIVRDSERKEKTFYVLFDKYAEELYLSGYFDDYRIDMFVSENELYFNSPEERQNYLNSLKREDPNDKWVQYIFPEELERKIYNSVSDYSEYEKLMIIEEEKLKDPANRFKLYEVVV